MGQNPSAPVSSLNRRKPMRRSFRSPFPRRAQTNQSLSATFNYVESDLKVNQLNINLATEEELMTLPGINRAIAKNVVVYRQAIGRFNKVEDLALVSGIGAERLDEIRPEIYVSKKKSQSCGSSRTQSMDSIVSNDVSPNYSKTPLDVNSATVFQLMTIRGINQELAASIVEYRDRRGDFFTLDDLLKVKGINQIKLNCLKSKLTVKSDVKYEPKRLSSEPRFSPPVIETSNGVGNGIEAQDVYELVSAYCQRPPVTSVDLPKNTIRVATWNLSDLSEEKAQNPAVREVFCLTILENRISFVAVQGLDDEAGLLALARELRNPVCKRVAEWKAPRGNWKSDFVQIQRHNGYFNLGFIYDSQVVGVSTVKMVQDNSMIRAAGGKVTFGENTLSVLNVHLASNSAESTLNTLVSLIKPSILLGDFTTITNLDKGTLDTYKPLLATGTSTKIGSQSGSYFFDNIFISEKLSQNYFGNCGVIRSGLWHLAIPRGWNWNGPVSEHCPVWAQFSS